MARIRVQSAEPTVVTMLSPDSATVSSGASTEILALNERRTFLSLRALGSNPDNVFLAFGEAAVSGTGIVLAPSDGFVFDAGGVPTQSVHAISDGAGTNIVAIQEGE